MPRSVRPYTPTRSEEAKTLAGRSARPPAERDRLTPFQADLAQTVREDRRRTAGAARLPVARG
jgi:hypothetical protein